MGVGEKHMIEPESVIDLVPHFFKVIDKAEQEQRKLDNALLTEMLHAAHADGRLMGLPMYGTRGNDLSSIVSRILLAVVEGMLSAHLDKAEKYFTVTVEGTRAGLTLCAFKRGDGQRTFLDDYKQIHAMALVRGWDAGKETLAEFVERCIPADSERNYLIG